MNRGKLGRIIGMEFRLTAANRAFLVITILGPFLIAGVSVLPGLLAAKGSGAVLSIAVTGGDAAFVEGIRAPLEQAGIRASAADGDIARLDERVLSGDLDGYLVLPADLLGGGRMEYVAKSVGDFRTSATLQGVVGQAIVFRRLIAAGLPADKVAALAMQPGVESRQIRQGAEGAEKEKKDYITVLMTGLAFSMMLYMTILLYGQSVGRSVLMEKTSKTVEIMLSSVSALELLFGKILGKALASLLQYAVWIVMAYAFLRFAGPALGIQLNLAFSTGLLAYLVLFFLLAFFLYCSAYAALGSAAEDENHLSQLAWPVILFLIAPVVMISSVIASPHAPLAVALSLFPLTAPIVMLLRIVVGGVEAWQIALCIALLLCTIAATIVLSARIFRVGILMSGKRFRLGEIVRWARS